MKAAKRKRLEQAGWRVGSAEDFLGLSKEEQTLVEIKLALADAVKTQREKHRLSQSDLAARMRSSQSRVAKIEAGDPSVSPACWCERCLRQARRRRNWQKLSPSHHHNILAHR